MMTRSLNRRGTNLSLMLVMFARWWPSVCLAGEPAPSPTHQTSGNTGPPPQSSSWSADTSNGIDFLVAAFFLIAAGWLVLALIYSVLVLLVVRLRARGQLDVYDENFGRLYLLGTRCYIPLGCVLRRYVVAMNNEGRGGDAATVRLMSREERRIALELLLTPDEEAMQDATELPAAKNEEEAVRIVSNETGLDDIDHSDQESHLAADEAKVDEEQLVSDDSIEEQVCAICLTEYEPTDSCITSPVCPHRFHYECIMGWLERRANTECPCCRTLIISDEEVWETVQKLRRERQAQNRKASKRKDMCCCPRRSLADDEGTVEPTTPPSSPVNRSFQTTGHDTRLDGLENNVIATVSGFEDVEVGGRD